MELTESRDGNYRVRPEIACAHEHTSTAILAVCNFNNFIFHLHRLVLFSFIFCVLYLEMAEKNRRRGPYGKRKHCEEVHGEFSEKHLFDDCVNVEAQQINEAILEAEPKEQSNSCRENTCEKEEALLQGHSKHGHEPSESRGSESETESVSMANFSCGQASSPFDSDQENAVSLQLFFKIFKTFCQFIYNGITWVFLLVSFTTIFLCIQQYP